MPITCFSTYLPNKWSSYFCKKQSHFKWVYPTMESFYRTCLSTHRTQHPTLKVLINIKNYPNSIDHLLAVCFFFFFFSPLWKSQSTYLWSCSHWHAWKLLKTDVLTKFQTAGERTILVASEIFPCVWRISSFQVSSLIFPIRPNT